MRGRRAMWATVLTAGLGTGCGGGDENGPRANGGVHPGNGAAWDPAHEDPASPGTEIPPGTEPEPGEPSAPSPQPPPPAQQGMPTAAPPNLTRELGPPGPDVPYPVPDWPEGDAASAGFDVAALERATQYSQGIGGQCFLVIRDGQLVWERYYNGGGRDRLQKSWSIAKSYTSALFGIAVRDGLIESLDEPAANYLPEWQSRSDVAPITIRHLLNMVSGLSFELVSDNTWTVFTRDMNEQAVNNTVSHPPDTVYEYSNHGNQVLNPVLANATGLDPEEYARRELWEPLGFGPNTRWERDGAGNVIMFMGVEATCRDFARFGYLYANGGFWNGEEIVPNWYVNQSVNPWSAPNAGHSHMWWLNGVTPFTNSTQEPQPGMMFPGVWPDLFGAQGIGQNFIDVIPSTRTIYVHMRPAPHDPLTNLIFDMEGTLDRLFRDGSQIEHKEMLDILMGAG